MRPEVLVELVAELVAGRAGRVRAVVDGPDEAGTAELGAGVAGRLRELGRATVLVSAWDYLRPASVRLEFGREDPDELLDGWLDAGALRREVLDPAGVDGSGRVLPRLWDASVDRAFRDTNYVSLPPDGVVLITGSMLLGRGLPLDVAVHLRMGEAAMRRSFPADRRWMLPAFARYAAERDPKAMPIWSSLPIIRTDLPSAADTGGRLPLPVPWLQTTSAGTKIGGSQASSSPGIDPGPHLPANPHPPAS